MRVLVIGGTGPTGHFIVNGLRTRGFRVAILHSGRHEIDEIPEDVEHIHADAYDADALSQVLAHRQFDLTIASYGRLRRIAELMVDRTSRFISIGGVPAYRGFSNPELHTPYGLPVPTSENAPLVRQREDDEKGFRIVRTEDAVFDLHPDATHFRYPYVYGPYQLMPREWCVVRRILDGRRRMIIPDDGLTLQHFGYAENLAHAVLLAVDHPGAAAGRIYNCGDAEVLSLRQVIETIAGALDHPLELISMPYSLATPARPLVMQPLATHRVFDLTRLKTELGYSDLVPPREALARTARWLVAHPPQPGGHEEQVLQDPFDYAAEDALIDRWQAALAGIEPGQFEAEPGFTLSYSGPGGRARSNAFD